MSSYFSAPKWELPDQCPNTSKTAKPIKHEDVIGQRVIVVESAMYRLATLNGAFLLSEIEVDFPQSGVHNVEVYCCWFGYRLKTRGILLEVDMLTAKVIENYTGEVVSNIGLFQ